MAPLYIGNQEYKVYVGDTEQKVYRGSTLIRAGLLAGSLVIEDRHA